MRDLKLSAFAIKEQAKKELYEEKFKEAVEKEKEKLRKKKSLLDVIFPYRIVWVKKK